MSGSGNNYGGQSNQGGQSYPQDQGQGDQSYYQNQGQGDQSYYQDQGQGSYTQDPYNNNNEHHAQHQNDPYFQPPLTEDNVGKHSQSQGDHSSTQYYLHQDKDQDFERVAQGIPKSSKGSKSKNSGSKGGKSGTSGLKRR